MADVLQRDQKIEDDLKEIMDAVLDFPEEERMLVLYGVRVLKLRQDLNRNKEAKQ